MNTNTQASPPPACPVCAAESTRIFRPGAPSDRPQITCPEEAAAIVVPMLTGLDREHGLLVALDSKHRHITTTTISIGSVGNTFLAPREVFRDALLAGASAIFVAHNHPSGDPDPSADDRHITRRLARAGAVLGVDVLDHLVIGHDEWVSLARLGML